MKLDPSQFQTSGPLLDLQKLQHFLAVYDLGNFARAANRVNITQQAVSKSVARLEAELDVKLFDRGGYGTRPTAYGDAFAKCARSVLNEARAATAEISALKGAEKGFVKVGFGWSLLSRVAPKVIARFYSRRPGITIQALAGDSRSLHDKLLNGKLDVVISAPPAGYVFDEGLHLDELYEERDVLVMRPGHPLSGNAAVTLEDLTNYTWIISLPISEQWRNSFIKNGCHPPTSIIDTNSVTLAKSVILKTDFLALMAEDQLFQHRSSHDFHVLDYEKLRSIRKGFLAVRQSSELGPGAKAFIQDAKFVIAEKNSIIN